MREVVVVPGRTKRTAARLALVAAMRESVLKPGDKLPSETALTKILGVSLGTVQAALRQLQHTGTIIRRRGDGTRVASVEPIAETIWHFRFLSKQDMRPLRVLSQVVQIDLIDTPGPWSEFFGELDDFIRIRRRRQMSDGSALFAEMYLDPHVVRDLVELDPAELDMVSIRTYLEETYGLHTAHARHAVGVMVPTRKEALALGLNAETIYFEVKAKAYSGDGGAIYFQRIFAEADRHILDF